MKTRIETLTEQLETALAALDEIAYWSMPHDLVRQCDDAYAIEQARVALQKIRGGDGRPKKK